jgi:hypothetical protein
MHVLSLTAGALAAAGALCATLPAAEAQPAHGAQSGGCFHLSQVANTRMVGFRTLYIRTGDNSYYRMDFGADCNNLGTEPLILHPFANNDLICKAIELNVSVRSTHQICNATTLEKMTPEETAAIPKRDLP